MNRTTQPGAPDASFALRSAYCTVLLLGLLAACSESTEQTKLVVSVLSDFSATAELDSVTATFKSSSDRVEQTVALSPGQAFPVAFVPVLFTGPEGDDLLIVVRGLLGGQVVVQQSARTNLTKGQTGYLTFDLSRACSVASVACSETTTCVQGACVDIPRRTPQMTPRQEPTDALTVGPPTDTSGAFADSGDVDAESQGMLDADIAADAEVDALEPGCPVGQTICGDVCATLGGSCAVGTGACARTGMIACTGGAPTCNATAGAAGTEICDSIDNDCDGQVDEGTKVSCNADGDNDRYATSATAMDLCPAAGRAAFGNCPLGYVAPANSLGVDCGPTDPNAYVSRSVRTDADGDSHCVGSARTSCIGAAAPGGSRYAESCVGPDDCNDANGGAYQSITVSPDADGDGYCANGSSSQCTGASAAPGTRASGSCLGVDCDDGNGGIYRYLNVRPDGDNDGYCRSGTAPVPKCSGAAPPSGWRASCPVPDDCHDGNGYATTTCTIVDGYITSSATKSCGIGPPPCESFGVNVDMPCGPGFHPENFVAGLNAPSTCNVLSPNAVQSCCGGIVFGTASCRIRATCVAD